MNWNADERPPASSSNRLLASISSSTLASLREHFTRRHVDQGTTLEGGYGVEGPIYFPETAVFCVRASVETGKQQGFALVGRDGALNWGLLAGLPAPLCQEMIAVTSGTVLVIDKRMLSIECGSHHELFAQLLGFAFHFACQLASTLRSSMSDSIDVRLSRWLLLWHDRVDDAELHLTHDLLAGLLAVRRATVTDALHILEGERLITSTRGRIIIRSRSLLEAHAGIAYGVADRTWSGISGA
ncbi:Crp/Fnr family transcriptional regulator [Sphingomonas sp. Y38-1Y]|uniref:Crp/Fnr family transcriptional regulator n=1 Tax=Sphingomonas sp. Y38-1Y TaxID=3078265 RepID=UPI0028EE6B64|nr:Crp/Fnr family transcriptional regulator [Sphingomonas sp. Y38-1Y]